VTSLHIFDENKQNEKKFKLKSLEMDLAECGVNEQVFSEAQRFSANSVPPSGSEAQNDSAPPYTIFRKHEINIILKKALSTDPNCTSRNSVECTVLHCFSKFCTVIHCFVLPYTVTRRKVKFPHIHRVTPDDDTPRTENVSAMKAWFLPAQYRATSQSPEIS